MKKVKLENGFYCLINTDTDEVITMGTEKKINNKMNELAPVQEVEKKQENIIEITLNDRKGENTKKIIVNAIKNNPKLLEQVQTIIDINDTYTSEQSVHIGSIEIYKEGLYISLSGTRCGKKFFINLKGEKIRKPRNIELIKEKTGYCFTGFNDRVELSDL